MKKELPEYIVPQVITYTDDELLEELGEAQAYGNGEEPGGGPGAICRRFPRLRRCR